MTVEVTESIKTEEEMISLEEIMDQIKVDDILERETKGIQEEVVREGRETPKVIFSSIDTKLRKDILNGIKTQIAENVARVRQGQALDETTELPCFLVPRSYEQVPLIIHEEIEARIHPDKKIDTTLDRSYRDDNGIGYAYVHYQRIPGLAPVQSKDGVMHEWFIRTTRVAAQGLVEIPDRSKGGESPWITHNHPKQLILRRSFDPQLQLL
jgi:hypothetical protein